MTVVYAYTNAEEHGSHEYAHGHVAHKRRTGSKVGLHGSDHKRQHSETEHRLYDKAATKVAQRAQEQEKVATIHGNRHRDAFAREIVDQRAKTRHPPDHHMVREDENGKSYGIYQYAEDYPCRLHYRTGAKFYKIKQGKFKTYWVCGDNCASFIDWILGQLGSDVLSIRGIITPGSYFEFLETEYMKKSSPVVYRKVHPWNEELAKMYTGSYKKKRFKTS